MDTTKSDQVARPTKAKRRWLRRFVILFCLLLIVVLAFVVLIPTLMSTSTGKRLVMDTISGQVAGQVDADSLSVSWRGGQTLTGLVVRDADGSEIARIGRIDLPDVSLLGLVQGGLGLGVLHIEQVRGDLVGYDDGTTNLQRALASTSGATSSTTTAPPPQTGQAGWPSGLSFTVNLRDVDVSYRAQEADEPIRLVISEADLGAMDATRLVANLKAEVSQGKNKGSITVDAKVDQLFDASGAYQLAKATTHIDSRLSDLPVELLDSLLQENGRLVALLGPVLNGHILADVTTAGGSTSIRSDSEQLHISTKVAFDDSGLKRDGESSIRYTLTPGAWAVLTKSGDASTSVLSKPVELAIDLNQLDLPFNEQGPDLSRLSVDLVLAISDTQLTIDNVGDVTLASTTGSIKTTQLGRTLAVGFDTLSGLNNKPGRVELDIELADLMASGGRFDPAHLSAKVNGQITNAPIAAILDELIPDATKGLATRSLGKAVDMTLSLHSRPDPDTGGMTGGFELDALTEGGEAGLSTTLIGSFAYSEKAIQARLADGSYTHLTVTQGLIDAYKKAFAEPKQKPAAKSSTPPQLTLGAPADLKLDLTQAAFQMNAMPDGGYELDPDSMRANARITSNEVRLMQDGQYAATLKDLLIDLANTGLSGQTRLSINAQIDYPARSEEESKPGSIKSDTTITGIARIDDQVSFINASYATDTTIRQAPIDLIDTAFNMGGELIAAVGPRALLTINGEYTPATQGTTGGLDLLLKSRASSADMKLVVENDRWTLKSDAPLSFNVTPRLSQTLLKKVNPFLGSAISAKLPIGVTVQREGFSAPLHDMAVKDINANIRLELGELDLRGEGQLKQVLTALGVGDQSLLNVSFSPVTLGLNGGKLSYQDLVMGFDEQIKLSFAGDVDLNSRALNLRMTIPGSTLSQIAWLKGSFKEDQAIVIPLTGTFDKPQLDVKLLTGELAKAALRGQLQDEAGGRLKDELGKDAGAAVGGLLEEILKTGKLPEPADDPAEADETSTDTTQDQADTTQDQADTPLTDEERAARKERRRLRQERLEREKAEQEAKQKQ